MQSIYGDEGVDAITGTDGTQEVQVRDGILGGRRGVFNDLPPYRMCS